MNVCIITTVHPPYDTRLFYKEAKSLMKKHKVTIIAPGTKKQRTCDDGMEIITFRAPKSKILHPITMGKVFLTGLRGNYDVVHCLEPGSLLIAVIYKALLKRKVVYDGHEYIASLIAENSFFPDFIRPLVKRFVTWGDLFLAGHADAIITVDEKLCEIYQQCNENVYIMPNYPSLELIDEIIPASKHYPLIYVGGISRERGIYQMLNVSQRTGIPLLCVGAFTNETNKNEIMNYIQSTNISTVTFTGRLPYAEAIAYIKSASIGFSLLQDLPRYSDVVPTKVYDYLACGKQVIVSDIPILRKYFSGSECCSFVDPKNEELIVDSVMKIINGHKREGKMGQQGRTVIENGYIWENNEIMLLQIYNQIPG